MVTPARVARFRLLLLVPALATALVATGCSSYTAPTLSVADARVTERSDQGMTLAFTIGIACWLAYGVARLDWPVIGSNLTTLALMLVILALKLRYG